MEKNLNGSGKESASALDRRLSRRAWVQRMLAGAGAGVAMPVLGTAHPAFGQSAAPAVAKTESAAGEGKLTFFDDFQNRTLVALAERIVPGSTLAQVSQFLDLAMGAETPESQRRFIAALNALEGEALQRFTKRFTDLSAEQQDAILTVASTAQPSHSQTMANPHTNASPASPVSNLRDYFELMKNWISVAYYTSEAGMKELGWTGDYFFESFPGCADSSTHA